MSIIDDLKSFWGFGEKTDRTDNENTDTFSYTIDEDINAGWNDKENIKKETDNYDDKILQTILYIRNMDLDAVLDNRDKNIIVNGNLVISDFLKVKNLYVMGSIENNGLCMADSVSSLDVNNNITKLREMFYHHFFDKSWTILPELLEKYDENDNIALTNAIIDTLFEVIDNLSGLDTPEIICFFRKILDDSAAYRTRI